MWFKMSTWCGEGATTIMDVVGTCDRPQPLWKESTGVWRTQTLTHTPTHIQPHTHKHTDIHTLGENYITITHITQTYTEEHTRTQMDKITKKFA